MPLLVDCVFKIKETVDSFKYEQRLLIFPVYAALKRLTAGFVSCWQNLQSVFSVS